MIDSGVEEGAELLLDGRGIEVAGHAGGHFVGPTLSDHVTPSMRIYGEEVFCPVLVVLRAETLAEAIELVSAGPYGNGAVVYTRDGHAARVFERGVQAGMVGINVPIPVPGRSPRRCCSEGTCAGPSLPRRKRCVRSEFGGAGTSCRSRAR